MSNDKIKFKVGDIVEAFGVKGRIDSVDESGVGYPIYALIGGAAYFFTEDGKFFPEGDVMLKLVERPKKTELKRYWLWDVKDDHGNIYKGAYYRDEEGLSTGKSTYDKEYLIKKHENEFVDVEVDSE